MNSKIGCLIIHGFAGNLDEIEPLDSYLRNNGYQTLCPTMKGNNCTEWINSAQEGLLELSSQCEHLVLIGFSMGGLIAVNLAKKYDVKGIVTLNTPIYHWDMKRIALNILKGLKTKDYSKIKYYFKAATGIPIAALLNFKILLHQTLLIFKDIQCPIFIAQGLMDDTVHHKSAQYLYQKTSSQIKVLKYYDKIDHHICQSAKKEEVFNDLKDFLSRYIDFT